MMASTTKIRMRICATPASFCSRASSSCVIGRFCPKHGPSFRDGRFWFHLCPVWSSIEHVFDYGDRLDELRCHSSEWLSARRSELVAEQRRLRVEELAVVAVLDERGAVSDATAAVDGVSVRAWRDTVETARALEDLPWRRGAARGA